MKNLGKTDYQGKGIEVEIEIIEIVEEGVMIDIVEVPVDLQVEMDIVEEIILLIEVIQEIDIIVDVIGQIIIGVEIDPDHQMKWNIILGDIKVEVIQDLDIQGIEDNHLKNVLSVVEQDILLNKYCWDFQKYLEKIG